MLEMATPDAQIGQELVDLRRQIDALELKFSQRAVAFEQSGHWIDDGFMSAIEWIRFNCKMMSNAAADRIAVGERMTQLAESTQAMEAGDIGFAHLTVMARTSKAVGPAFDEAKLLNLARDSSPGKFHYQCLHYRHSVNAKAYAAEQAELAENTYLHLNMQEDGCVTLVGLLDPVGGAAIRAALQPLARLSGAHDDRKLPRRQADALVELITGKQQKVAMQVTASIETLLGLVGAPGAENEFSLPISSKTVERWACDSSLARILLQDSVVIDVGRAERTIKGPRRKALIARDRHCQWPGCERPASYCDSHHLVHWLFGGGGEIDNQVLLCHRHHRMVHEGGWQLVRTEDGRLIAVPPTVTFGPAPPHSWGGGPVLPIHGEVSAQPTEGPSRRGAPD